MGLVLEIHSNADMNAAAGKQVFVSGLRERRERKIKSVRAESVTTAPSFPA